MIATKSPAGSDNKIAQCNNRLIHKNSSVDSGVNLTSHSMESELDINNDMTEDDPLAGAKDGGVKKLNTDEMDDDSSFKEDSILVEPE